MNTAIIEKVLDLVCEELNKKWIGYDTNYIYRDSFLNNILSYDYLISDKWLQYLATYINIETETEMKLIEEITVTNIFDKKLTYYKIYRNDDNYDITVIQNADKTFTLSLYEKIDTIKQISCNYDYLCNIVD